MKTEIDIILGELLIFQHPEYFIPKFDIEKNKGNKFNSQKLKDYQELISGINWFVKKISRYEIFFDEFYPDTNKITKHEALEHHIHAYLEDLETLKNKLINFVGKIKNDSKKQFQNKDEINNYFVGMKDKIYEAFRNVSENRSPHRHGNYRFVDTHVIDGEAASMMLGDNFADMLTEYGQNKLQKQEEESFEKGKKYWSQNAQKNFNQVQGLTNEIMKINKKLLFKLIDIRPYGIKNIKNK